MSDVKRYSRKDIKGLIATPEEMEKLDLIYWVRASDYDALEQRLETAIKLGSGAEQRVRELEAQEKRDATAIRELHDELERLYPLRESLREAERLRDLNYDKAEGFRQSLITAEASLREQEELLQWAERVEEGITIQFEAREMTGVVAWTGEHVATTPTILAALRALRERVALCPERITPHEPKPPLHQI